MAGIFHFLLLSSLFLHVSSLQILSKTKLQKCEKVSKDNLDCNHKVVVDLAVPSESSGREASMVAEIVEVEDDSNSSSSNMRTLRAPPVITVNKSAAYALYHLSYIRDVAYKPVEYHVETRKCEADAGADIVQICERLRDSDGHIIEETQPTCCPCGDQRRVPSSCGNFFDKMMKGKKNTAHCLRFPGDWFHVFGIGQSSVGFTLTIQVKTKSKTSEVVLGPENRTATSGDNFLKANLIGDYVGYQSIPSLDDYYLVIPRQGGAGQPPNLGSNFSMWMLLERVRFTLDGVECNKIGVDYGAFNGQPDFCSSPLWSCLHNQLWNFWDTDQNRISRKQVPLYCVQGRFERINQHPNAGNLAFSIGITEVLNTNLLLELSADDIEYVYQRSPGKIVSIEAPTFEALTQFGTVTITTKNIGDVEASYSLTFDCSAGVTKMEEQFYIMKPNEVITRFFKLYPTSDQATRHVCSAILKDSGFEEVDRAECQFTTTATVIDNGTQIPFEPPKTSINGFFESIEDIWNKLWHALAGLISGKGCSNKCAGFFDVRCHIQYICMSWVVMFGLVLAIIPTVIVLFWLLHQQGLFDPLYDWFENHSSAAETKNVPQIQIYHDKREERPENHRLLHKTWKTAHDNLRVPQIHHRKHEKRPENHRPPRKAWKTAHDNHRARHRSKHVGETDQQYKPRHVHREAQQTWEDPRRQRYQAKRREILEKYGV